MLFNQFVDLVESKEPGDNSHTGGSVCGIAIFLGKELGSYISACTMATCGACWVGPA